MELFSEIAAVALVLGLLGASLWWLRHRGLATIAAGRHGAGRRMECLERLALGPQHSLHLVRMGEKALLLACWPGGCTLLESLRHQDVDTRREILP